jgi:probable F420-dependent oxidoreductase
MTLPNRPGMTVPFGGPLHQQRAKFEELADLGYTDVWSAESDGVDAFTPLILASQWAPSLRLGTAIVPAFTRAPAVMAQSVAAAASAAPGRFAFGIGTSSNVIVERWNGVPFVDPYKRVRDMVRFLRVALTGEKVTEKYDSFEVQGFRLGLVPEVQPPILVAALREGMLRLAGREGDGAIINWLSADDVKTVVPHVGEGKEIVARIFVLATTDRDLVRYVGRRSIAAYLNVPVYAQFHEWLGRGAMLAPMWDAWKAGDRTAATEAIPDELIDQIIVHGTADEIRDHLARFVENGVTTPAPAILGAGDDVREVVRALAPKASERA